jgi:hypothetical protein
MHVDQHVYTWEAYSLRFAIYFSIFGGFLTAWLWKAPNLYGLFTTNHISKYSFFLEFSAGLGHYLAINSFRKCKINHKRPKNI